MLAPKTISSGSAASQSASAARAAPMAASVSRLVGYAQWVLALWWQEVVRDRVHHDARHLRAAGAVEVRHRMAVVAALEGRKVARISSTLATLGMADSRLGGERILPPGGRARRTPGPAS